MITKLFGAYRNLSCDSRYLEWYRSGHNEHDWKSCGRVERPEGSNPSHSAKSSEHFGSMGEKSSDFKVFGTFYARKFSKYSMAQW